MELWAESLRVEEVAASVATAMAQLRAEELPRVTPLHRVPDRAERPLNLQRPAASMLRLMPPARFVESEARAVRTWALAGEATQLAAAQWAALAGWRVARSWWCPTRMARSVVVEGRTRLRASHRSVRATRASNPAPQVSLSVGYSSTGEAGCPDSSSNHDGPK